MLGRLIRNRYSLVYYRSLYVLSINEESIPVGFIGVGSCLAD